MDDPWGRFWDRLIVDWVAVILAAFVLQGLWFGVVAFLVGGDPGTEEAMARATSVLKFPWGLGIAAGLGLGVFRAAKRV